VLCASQRPTHRLSPRCTPPSFAPSCTALEQRLRQHWWPRLWEGRTPWVRVCRVRIASCARPRCIPLPRHSFMSACAPRTFPPCVWATRDAGPPTPIPSVAPAPPPLPHHHLASPHHASPHHASPPRYNILLPTHASPLPEPIHTPCSLRHLLASKPWRRPYSPSGTACPPLLISLVVCVSLQLCGE
jgi:hypothetical protein